MHRWNRLLLLCALVMALGGCCCCKKKKEKDYARPLPEGQMALRKLTDPGMIPDFAPAYKRRQGLIQAIDYSLDYLSHPSSQEFFPYLEVTHEQARQSLEVFRDLLLKCRSGEELNGEIRARFDVFESVGCDDAGTVLFTGYCQPIYDARVEPDSQYRYPLYKLPADLVKDRYGTPQGRKTDDGVVPYYTRKEIEQGQLLEGLELVYLKSKLEAFIIHVQGSARLRLADGGTYSVGYAGKTDRPYTSIGQRLVADGKIKADELSLRKIRDYFDAHPEELDHYLWQNECFVFFTKVEGGPYGCLGVPVTAYRSIATDKDVYPRACLAFFRTKLPERTAGRISQADYASFALDQDRGGAIRSAGRVDIFMGTGAEAEELAGRTRQEGRIYYLFLKPDLVMPRVSVAGGFCP